MDDCDMGDGRVVAQARFDRDRVRWRVLGRLVNGVGASHVVAHFGHAMAIGAVDQDQQLAVAGQEGRDHRLHGESPAALQRDTGKVIAAAGDFNDALADLAVDRDERRVPRAPVPQHRLARFLRGRQGSGGQEIRLLGIRFHGAGSDLSAAT